MLWHLGPWCSGKTVPSRARKFLGIVNNSCVTVSSNINQPIQSPHSHCHLHQALTLDLPRARYQKLGKAPMLQGLLKLFILANPKPSYAAVPIPYWRTQNKGSHPRLLPLPLSPKQPLCFWPWLHGACYALLLGTKSSKISFLWKLSPDMLAFQYLSFSIHALYF